MKSPILAAISFATLGLAGCDTSTTINKPPGKYENTEVSTNARGTTTVKKVSSDVSVDEYGNKQAVVTKKVTKDPKGLFNKTTTSNTAVITEEKY